MFAILGIIFHVLGFLLAVVFGLVAIVFSLFFGVLEFSLLAPLIVVLAVLGLFFWHPLLWIGLAVMVYYLIRMNRKKRYIELKRHNN